MKIFNAPIQPTDTQKYKKDNPNFKALSPLVQKQLTSTANGPAKDIFIKLSALAGLGGIIGWVNSIVNKGTTEKDYEALNTLSDKVSDKANAYLTNPESMDTYLTLNSAADNTGASIWAKGIKHPITPGLKKEVFSDGSEEALLNPQINEEFLEEVQSRKLESILEQTKILSASDKYEEISKKLDEKISDLVKEADDLKKDEKTADLYSKLANITKKVAIINFIEAMLAQKEEIKQETLQQQEDVQNEPVEKPAGQTIVEKKEVKPKYNDIQPLDADFKPIEDVDYKAKDRVVELRPTVIGKIDIEKLSGNPKNLQIIETEENKEFLDKFKSCFAEDSHLSIQAYAEQIDFIKAIYDSYSEKLKNQDTFLRKTCAEDCRKEINLYKELTGGEPQKVDYLTFKYLQTNKHLNGGDFTQEEFDTLNEWKNCLVKYYDMRISAKNPMRNRLIVPFVRGVSLETKLETLKDIYKIVFNVSDQTMIKGSDYSDMTVEDIQKELIERILYGKEDSFSNIVKYLELDKNEKFNEIKNNIYGKDFNDNAFFDAEIEFRELLNSDEYREKLNNLAEIIENKGFDDFIIGLHARMRFVDRFVLEEDKSLIGKSKRALKMAVTKEINWLKDFIKKQSEFTIQNYDAKKRDKTYAYKKGPQIVMDLDEDHEIIIGLNNKAQIQTILKRDKYKYPEAP